MSDLQNRFQNGKIVFLLKMFEFSNGFGDFKK
jgi:hypothetical protein